MKRDVENHLARAVQWNGVLTSSSIIMVAEPYFIMLDFGQHPTGYLLPLRTRFKVYLAPAALCGLDFEG